MLIILIQFLVLLLAYLTHDLDFILSGLGIVITLMTVELIRIKKL